MHEAEVLLHPESRLVTPATEQVFFYCKIANGPRSFWVINGIPSVYDDQVARLRSQGYVISTGINGTVTTLTLTVDVTVDKNHAQIYCTYHFETISRTAALLVLSSGKYEIKYYHTIKNKKKSKH